MTHFVSEGTIARPWARRGDRHSDFQPCGGRILDIGDITSSAAGALIIALEARR